MASLTCRFRLGGLVRTAPVPILGMLTVAMVVGTAGCGPGAGAPTTVPDAPSQVASTAKPLAPLPLLTLQATVGGFSGPASIVATSDAVWVLDHSASTQFRIDPATNALSGNVYLGAGYSNGLGLAGDRLWTFNQTNGAILAVDPETAKIVETVQLGGDGDVFAVGDDAAWLISGGSLSRIDGVTAKVATYPIPAPCDVAGLAVGGGFAWIASDGGGLCKIDERTGELVQHGTGVGQGSGMAIVGGTPWLAGADNGLSIIDATTLEVATAIPAPAPGAFEGSKYSIGTADENAVITGAVDGKTGWLRYTGATIGRVTVGGTPTIVLYAGFPADLLGAGVLEAFGSLWVTNFGAATVERYQLPT